MMNRASRVSRVGVSLPRALRTLRRCLVCGFGEVVTDEVVDRGVVLLAECPRCDHRWTEKLPASPPALVRVTSVERDAA